ncbi:MAG: glycosyltransferase family 4 protein [Planctomycetes bacterium]|nr:glycosyltransferase family 4 protein [Planctomycetota bacterium]
MGEREGPRSPGFWDKVLGRVLHIGIDASPLATPAPTGVAASVRSLLDGIARLDSTHRYYACYRVSRLRRARTLYRPEAPNFRVRVLAGPFHPMLRRRLHLFHGTDTRLPRLGGVPLVATVHDLASLRDDCPVAGARFRARRAADYADAAVRASRIVVHTEAVGREVRERLLVRPDRVRLIPLAPSAAFRPVSREREAEVRARYGLAGPYFLFVGQASPRKNLERLVEAFAPLGPSTGGGTPSPDLVLVGGGEVGPALDKARELGVGLRVRSFAHLPEEDLPALYSGALALVYVSTYEGFGLPVLEAMACGVPVVASDIPALAEVGGGAATLVDPLDTASMAMALRAVATDAALRHQLATSGLARARRLDPDRTARETLKVYQEVLQEAWRAAPRAIRPAPG